MHARRCHKAGGFSFPVEELAAARAPKERGPGERPDTGPGFVARALLTWIAAQGSGTTLIGPRQAVAERHRRELQQQVPRRVPERRMVSCRPFLCLASQPVQFLTLRGPC